MQQTTASHQSHSNHNLLTPEEVAQWLRVSMTTVYRLVEGRHLPFVRVSRLLRFTRADIEAYLKMTRVETIVEKPYGRS